MHFMPFVLVSFIYLEDILSINFYFPLLLRLSLFLLCAFLKIKEIFSFVAAFNLFAKRCRFEKLLFTQSLP